MTTQSEIPTPAPDIVPVPAPVTAPPAVEALALRTICSLFVTGVTVITSGVAGRSAGTTVNSFTSVSLEPPLVLFCLHRQSRLLEVARESERFVVNFLSGRQEQLARAFAGRKTAQLEDFAHRRTDDGMPVLDNALAYLSCRLVDEMDGGDHTILLGEVVGLGAAPRHTEPLVFFRGTMGMLEDELYFPHPIWDG